MRTYYKICECQESEAGEVVARCEAASAAQARRKLTTVERDPNTVDVVAASRLPANVYDPRGLVRDPARDKLAASMGVLPSSKTFARFLAGDIDEAECRRIGKITAHRHEQTDYDELLERGLDRAEARHAIMAETPEPMTVGKIASDTKQKPDDDVTQCPCCAAPASDVRRCPFDGKMCNCCRSCRSDCLALADDSE